MRISDWSSDVCSSDLVHIAFDHEHAAGLAGSGRGAIELVERAALVEQRGFGRIQIFGLAVADDAAAERDHAAARVADRDQDRKSTRLNSSHSCAQSYAVLCSYTKTPEQYHTATCSK